MRQTVRLNEVRAPSAPNDSLAPGAIRAIDGTAATLDDHYQGVLSQIKNLLGAATWKEPPAASVLGLSDAQKEAARRVAAQVATIAAHDQALADQAKSINQLSGQVTALLALKASVSDIQAALAALGETYASRAQVQLLADQIASMDRNVVAQINQVQGQLAQALSELATQDARIHSLEAAQGNYVTAQGLQYVLSTAFVVDAELVGAKDAGNLAFKTAKTFVVSTLVVKYNGQTVLQGRDYIVAAVGDGLVSDTIRLLHPEAAPHARDVLTATYLPAI